MFLHSLLLFGNIACGVVLLAGEIHGRKTSPRWHSVVGLSLATANFFLAGANLLILLGMAQ